MSSSNNYFSHPGKLISEHLKNVADNARFIAKSNRLNLSQFLSEEVLYDVVYIIGAAHDFGKFTKYFQEYLFAEEPEKKHLKNKPETRHSFISAIFVLEVLNEYLKEKELLEKEYYKYLPILAFHVVRRHHGDLRDILDDLSINEEEVEICRKQISAINFTDVQKIYDSLFGEINFSFDLKIFEKKIFGPIFWAYELKDKARDLEELRTPFFFLLQLFLYSLLLDSDKSDAAELLKIERKSLTGNLVDKYRAEKFGSNAVGINAIRNEIYNEVTSSVKEVNLEEEKIFSLNVPTGSGKTLTAFSFALKLRERIEKEKGFTPRIIYSLPFLSIIEQNYDVIDEVLGHPASDVLLKHHHLSEIFYSSSEDEYNGNEADIGKSILLIEGWNSEVIVTTFVQFFHSLITNRNRAARKIHNIVNSIVIFDEIQAMPHQYWLLFESLINFLAEYFNTYFIVMTATEPNIFKYSKSLIKIKSKGKFFSSLNRYLLKINEQETSLENFVSVITKHLRKEREKDFLIVMNSIKSSIKVYDALNNTAAENDVIYYLSTNIVPKTRSERITEIRKPSEKRKIIVSTQMIEAGVDIDVDVVYRDFAPLDSINQTAGRCNRNFKSRKGEVNLVNIFQENEVNGKKYFPKTIYDSFLLSKAEETLNKKQSIEEKDFLSLTEKYFVKVTEGKSDDKSREILDNVRCLNFSEISKFTLIEKDYPTVDFLIAVDKNAGNIWAKYEQISNDETLSSFEKRNEYLKIRKDLNDYIISVPKNLAVGFEEGTINFISNELLNNFYDKETGFKRENSGNGVVGF